MEVRRHPNTPIKVSGTAVRSTVLPFSTSFSTGIINAPCYKEVKTPTIELYDRITDPEEHIGVYKAHMYV